MFIPSITVTVNCYEQYCLQRRLALILTVKQVTAILYIKYDYVSSHGADISLQDNWRDRKMKTKGPSGLD